VEHDAMNDASEQMTGSPLPLLAAADLQDHLMTATNDLDRLQTLLADACEVLAQSFYGANEQLRALKDTPAAAAAPGHVLPGTHPRSSVSSSAAPSPRCSSRTWPPN
jgi:hypothetical protein